MKKGRRFSILVSLTLVLALLATYIPAYAVAANEDVETILYQEDFNSRELIPGEVCVTDGKARRTDSEKSGLCPRGVV